MCNCKDGNCKGACVWSMIGKILLIVGGLNWGLVGAGMLLGSFSSWNIVEMLLGSMPVVEAIVYLLVGVAAIMKIFGCHCKKCTSCQVDAKPMTGNMDAKM